MKRVTGIGGVFFKCKDPKALKAWYKKHLGIPAGEYGWLFQWKDGAPEGQTGTTTWSLFPENTDYLDPSPKDFMINYRVHDLEALLPVLHEEGVEQVGEMMDYEYGKFAWILDPEGNKIELWEPADQALVDFDEAEKAAE